MHTVSLELSKQLKDNGYPQDSSHEWFDYWGKFSLEIHISNEFHGADDKNYYASPTADEILDQLTEELDINKSSEEPFDKWQIDCGEVVESDNCLANAAAKAWLHLKKEGLL